MSPFEKPQNRAQDILKETTPGERLPKGFWMDVMRDIGDTIGEESSPLSIRAAAMIRALGIPSGEGSALTTRKKEGGGVEYVDLEKDKKIAELLTNIPGVHIENGVTSMDIRDLYKAGDEKLEELLGALDPDVANIIRGEYEIRHSVRERFPNTKKERELDVPVHFLRLPGGISVFLRGYIHNEPWQHDHGLQLAATYARAQIIGIEAFPNKPFGKSIALRWSGKKRQTYDLLMRQLVDDGFRGAFAQFDAHNIERIRMDWDQYSEKGAIARKYPLLPQSFYDQYYAYLVRENPDIRSAVGTSTDLLHILQAQSSKEIDEKGFIALNDSTLYDAHPSITPNEIMNTQQTPNTASTMTGLELGQAMFRDALSTLKFHMTARLMTEDKLPRGIIADFKGSGHLSGTSFFMRYPIYAAMVVLNNIHELMAGTAEKVSDNNAENVAAYAEKLFTNPDWPAIFREITKLAFFDVKDGTELVERPMDYCSIFGIDSETAIPSDERVAEIMEKLNKSE